MPRFAETTHVVTAPYRFDMCGGTCDVVIYSKLCRIVWTENKMYMTMAALRSRCGHYILVLLLSFFFSSPNLSSRRLDVYHTSTHGMALVRI